jgi:YVTN family beta-propeller protein
VSVIDTATNSVVATVAVGNDPVDIAITPNGAFAYVVNDQTENVSVIDTSTNTVVGIVPVGLTPRGVAITPDGAFAYVTNESDSTVSVIATATNAVVDTVRAVTALPEGLAIAPQPGAVTCR